MIGIPGTSFSSEVQDLVTELNPCGVILFARNIEHPVQTAELNHDLQQHALALSPHGLFIGVDQEGGRVRRLLEPYTAFPPALTLANSREPEDAVRRFAQVTAREIRSTGFNLDFVPVLDVLPNAENLESTVIGDRSFGFDPETVSRLGRIVVHAMRDAGIITCAKHFPGHGGTLVDSHEDLPVDKRPAGLLEHVDLVPFRNAVDDHVEMVMTAHILYEALDSQYPATLSHDIITGILRHTMSYDGVVITDDLDMGAVSNRFSIETCSLMAIKAGVDVLLICHSVDKVLSARAAVAQAVSDGEISEFRIRESLKRIRLLKAAYANSMNPVASESVRDYFNV